MNTKTVKVDNAVGKVLMHDVTCVIPGEFKGPAFKKGYVIREEDVSVLKRLGKENIYVFDIPGDEYHEDEAGELFKKFAGANVKASGPSEGKITFSAQVNGLVKIDKATVTSINLLGDIAFTTIHSHIPIKKDENIAGIRIIPLTLKKEIVNNALTYMSKSPISVVPFSEKQVGLIVTGNEVVSGKVKDNFKPIISKKIDQYNSKIRAYKILADDQDKITAQILAMIDQECNFIILTGGMSIDPDDTTKLAIKNAGVDVVSYGVPILPGNMFMAGYLKDIPVFGVPAAAVFFDKTVLDLFLPYVFSDTKIVKEDLIYKGYGGFCRHCEVCNFPYCAFGKS